MVHIEKKLKSLELFYMEQKIGDLVLGEGEGLEFLELHSKEENRLKPSCTLETDFMKNKANKGH